jgi:monovalent cation/hydrogen antiporter
MDLLIIYLILFSIIVIIGQLFRKSTVPTALVFVITGMLLSFIPFFPEIHLNSILVLNVFLPFLVYEICAFSSWRDMKKQVRPIALLSIGHVIFITCIIAVVIHALIPQIGWPLAFVLGAIVSPPDDVAIVSIAEKMHIPERIFIILEGEGIFNDAAALTIFRFALAAAITHQFLFGHVFLDFAVMIIGETLYGFVLGHILGKLRTKISNPMLHLIAALITPFIAYIPIVKLGGSGIIATAIMGFVIGNQYGIRFRSDYRSAGITILPTIAFAMQSAIFLLVGLNMHSTLIRISSIPLQSLFIYVTAIAAVVIIGRFIWVYGFVIFLPRFLFPSLKKRDPYPSWKYPFIISWAGIRGGISLAAALAIPTLTFKINDVDIRDLWVFIVFSIIFVTLILQGLSLPLIIKKLGIDKIGESERYTEHLSELQARVAMINAALRWLHEYKQGIKYNKKLAAETDMSIYEYQMLKKQFESRILDHEGQLTHDERSELREKLSLLCQVIEVEKTELEKLWRENQVNLKTRNKLATILDHQIQRNII